MKKVLAVAMAIAMALSIAFAVGYAIGKASCQPMQWVDETGEVYYQK